MADRKMISASVVGSDSFIELSYQAQALYIQLVLECDSYGFCSSVKKVMRYIGVKDDTLKELEDAFFVIRFDTGVYVIRHWFTQNYGGEFAKNDRTIKTEFIKELAQLTADFDGSYVWLDSSRNPTGFHPDTEWSASLSHSLSSESKVRADKYISKALGVVSASASVSVSEEPPARAHEETQGFPEEPSVNESPARDKDTDADGDARLISGYLHQHGIKISMPEVADLIAEFDLDSIFWMIAKTDESHSNSPTAYFLRVCEDKRETGKTNINAIRYAECDDEQAISLFIKQIRWYRNEFEQFKTGKEG